jgi:hypothetical protein
MFHSALTISKRVRSFVSNGVAILMCGRFTKKYTWQEIHALYRLMVPSAIPNMQPSYNVCPTDPVDVVVDREGKR